jgi:hypothetical protein
MESGFSALAQVAATLFGLVLVSLVFAYTTAISRIDSIGELRWLRMMTLEDRVKFKGLYWTQTALPIIIFLFFQVTIWRALIQPSVNSLEWAMYTALTYSVFLAALRAVILVGASFSAIVILHGWNNKISK